MYSYTAEEFYDLTEAGLDARDIALLYFADEPHMRAVFDAVLKLDEHRRLTLLLLINLMFDEQNARPGPLVPMRDVA